MFNKRSKAEYSDDGESWGSEPGGWIAPVDNAIIDCLDSSVVSLSTFMVAFSPDDGVKLTVTDWENLGK